GVWRGHVIGHLDSRAVTCLMLTVTRPRIKPRRRTGRICRLDEGSEYHLDQEPVAKGHSERINQHVERHRRGSRFTPQAPWGGRWRRRYGGGGFALEPRTGGGHPASPSRRRDNG